MKKRKESDRFSEPDKLQNHNNKGKGKAKKGTRGKKGVKEKKSMLTLSFYNGYFGDGFWSKKTFWTQKVYLAVTFSKIWLDVY